LIKGRPYLAIGDLPTRYRFRFKRVIADEGFHDAQDHAKGRLPIDENLSALKARGEVWAVVAEKHSRELLPADAECDECF